MSEIILDQSDGAVAVPMYRFVVHASEDMLRRGLRKPFVFQVSRDVVGAGYTQTYTQSPHGDTYFSVVAVNEEHAIKVAQHLAESVHESQRGGWDIAEYHHSATFRR